MRMVFRRMLFTVLMRLFRVILEFMFRRILQE